MEFIVWTTLYGLLEVDRLYRLTGTMWNLHWLELNALRCSMIAPALIE